MAWAMRGYFGVQSLPRRVMIFTLPASSRACMRYPSSFISWSQSGPSGAFFTSAASWGLTQAGRDARSTPRRVGGIVARSDFGTPTMYQNVCQETKTRAIRSGAPFQEKYRYEPSADRRLPVRQDPLRDHRNTAVGLHMPLC